jgi:hypothetical protein
MSPCTPIHFFSMEFLQVAFERIIFHEQHQIFGSPSRTRDTQTIEVMLV